jgi:hypothetical protein
MVSVCKQWMISFVDWNFISFGAKCDKMAIAILYNTIIGWSRHSYNTMSHTWNVVYSCRTNQPTNQQMSKQVNQSASHCSIKRLSCGSTIAMNLALIKVRTWAGNTFTNTSENHRVVISDTSTECSIKCADSAGICSLINSFIVSWSTCCV